MAAETDRNKPYPFSTIGAEIAAAVTQAADNLVAEATSLQDRAKVIAEGINAQIQEQTKQNEDMSERLRVFSQSLLDAHEKFMNGK